MSLGGIALLIGLGTEVLWEAPEAATYVYIVAGGLIEAGVIISALSYDPNDPNFIELPVPSFPKLPPMRPVTLETL